MGGFSDYWNSSISVNKDEAFILIPYNCGFESVLESIKKVCESLKIKARRADDMHEGLIISNIIQGIVQSEIIIADVSEGNPNVFFELGIAQARRESGVIIISRDRNKTPFDVRNWQILSYETNNLKKFEDELCERIVAIRKNFGQEQLLALLLKGCPSDQRLIPDFLDRMRLTDSNNYVSLICSILSDNSDISMLNSDNLIHLNQYLVGIADEENEKFLNLVNYLRIVVFSSHKVLNTNFSTVKQLFLEEWKISPVEMPELPQFEVSSRICFQLIEMNHNKKSDAIDWIFNYLNNKRMGRIDYVRANIASFLITSNDSSVNDALLGLLSTDNHSSLETAIDICGQKKLHTALDSLLSILQSTDDPFIARSTMYALSRLNSKNSAKLMYEWMLNHRERWGEKAVSSRLKEDAISALTPLDEKYRKQVESLS